MNRVLKVLWKNSRCYSVKKICNMSMEENIKEIFHAAVNAVKPSELIIKHKFIKFHKDDSSEILEIGQGESARKIDLTGKTLQLGKLLW
jgi:hypothetical protein